MGCVRFPIWIGIVIGTVVLSLIIGIVVISRKLDVIKFFLFIKFDILINDDILENVDDLEFDAFVIYRYDIHCGIKCFQNYKKGITF